MHKIAFIPMILAAFAASFPATAAAEQINCMPNGYGGVSCETVPRQRGMFDGLLEEGDRARDAYMREQEAIRRLRMQDLQIQQMQRQMQQATQAGQNEIFANTDSSGSDLENVKNVSLETCALYCGDTQGCVAVSWVEKTRWCWLKSSLGDPRAKRGVTTILMGR